MIIIICNLCKKIVGCGITPNGDIINQCVHCKQKCPFGKPEPIFQADALIINFINKCSGHDPPPIGFHLNHK